MSISDLIVVMKEGVVQQIGAPQTVYDDPVNLFVAKFLGTPPINVFAANVRAGKLFIGEDAVLDVPGVADQAVIAAIRPEGFVPGEGGAFSCGVKRVEVMGRDVSVVCEHPLFTGESFRAIIDSDDTAKVAGSHARFDLKPGKVFLFDAETQARIRF